MYSEGQNAGRIFFLADLDCFFVEVERLHCPQLHGQPVVIGGRPGFRGVVAACSYEAREFGIRSAMPMNEAYRLVREAGGTIVDGPGEEREQATGNREQQSGSAGVPPATREKGKGKREEKEKKGGNEIVARPSLAANSLAGRDARPTGNDNHTPPPPAYGAAVTTSRPAPRPSSLRKPAYFLHENLFGNYELYSRRIQDILRAEVPVFKAKSIDEFEMDISGCERLFTRDYGGVIPFAEYLRRRVKEEVGLKLSIGIGPGRIIAKMASRHAKPDGVFRVLPEDAIAFLNPHDVQAVPGIGPAIGASLRNLGVNRVEQLLSLKPHLLQSMFGIGMPKLLDALNCRDNINCNTYFGYEEQGDSEDGGGVRIRRKPKSIGHETTFEKDIIDPAVWERTLWRLTEDACRRLRAADLRARHVTLKIRYSDFATHTHCGMLAEATDVDSVIFERVKQLFYEGNTRRLRIRLLGVRLSRFSVGASQGLLFATGRDLRERRFFGAVDQIREKHGKDMVLVGPGVMKLRQQRRTEALSTAGIKSGFMHGRE